MRKLLHTIWGVWNQDFDGEKMYYIFVSQRPFSAVSA